MEVCKSDVRTIARYLSDAARVYDALPGLRNANRARMLGRMVKKLNRKLSKDLIK